MRRYYLGDIISKTLIDDSEGALPPPGAKLALQRIEKDPRNEPQYGERYPLVLPSYIQLRP